MVTQPTQPDSASYPDFGIPGVAPADFHLGAAGLSPEAIARVHERFLAYLAEKSATLLGYQCDLDLDYKEALKDYLDFHLNNIGCSSVPTG